MHSPTAETLFKLHGRVAVVTGAAGGIGLAICEQLHALGAQVVEADISHDGEPVGKGSGASTTDERRTRVRTDVADPNSVASLAALVKERWGRCDVLVNNAAITAAAMPLESLDLATWDKIMGVNLRGALLCAQALVPLMLAQGSGSIVNVASIAARAHSAAPHRPARRHRQRRGVPGQ